jgi:dihydroxyacid dehydratase/phosphogluconate dehydratase
MVRDGRRPSAPLSRGSFLNTIVALAAVGGSTNAVIHLLAIAGRLRTGDYVNLDVPRRRLELDVSEEELVGRAHVVRESH